MHQAAVGSNAEEISPPQHEVPDLTTAMTLAKELKEWMRTDGRPHKWRWHSHTKPAKGAAYEVIDDDVTVPDALRARVGRAPCPQCSPREPKFFKGWLFWFSEERCLRIIGQECSRHIAGDDKLSAAKSRLDERRADSIATGFLIDNLSAVAPILDKLATLSRRVRTLDEATKEMRSAFSEHTVKALARAGHNGGRLPLREIRQEEKLLRNGTVERDKDGNAVMQDVEVEVGAIAVQGLCIFARNQLCEATIRNAEAALVGLTTPGDDDALQAFVEGLGTKGRIDAEKNIRHAARLLTQALEHFNDAQQLLDQTNLDTLNEWGRDPRASLSIMAKRYSARIELGERKGRKRGRIYLSPHLFDPLPSPEPLL